MQFKKKWIIFIFVFSIVLTSIPNYTYAITTYADYGPSTVEGSNGEYVMVFVQDRIANEESVEQTVRSRNIKRLPTELQVDEINDTVIQDETFILNSTSFYTNLTQVVYFNDKAYLFFATQDLTTNNMTFFIRTSTDNGVTWSDLFLLYNTSVPYEDDGTSYYNFYATHNDNDLVLAYGFNNIIFDVNSTDSGNKILEIDPDTLEITDSFYFSPGYGKDFKLYNHEGDLLLIHTLREDFYDILLLKNIITHTVSFDNLDANYEIDSNIAAFDPPNDQLNLTKPTVIYWLDQFYMVAQDNLTDAYDIGQGIIKKETFLWGKSFKVEPGFISGYQAISNTIQSHDVIKNQDNFDGYYRRDPCLSVYEERLFLTFTVGRGDRFGGKGWPSVAFAFSTDGDIWTNNFLGEYTLFANLGTYFAIGTVGLFAIVYPSYLVYSKKFKGKK